MYINDLFFAYSPTLNYIYDVRGILNYSFSEWKIEPRDINDISETVGIVEPGAETSFSAWPNPASGMLHIAVPHEGAELFLSDVRGTVIKREHASGIVQWNVSGLAPGIYLLRCGSRTKKIALQ